MSYERKSVEVEALKLASAVYDKDGGLLADKGEWVVVDGPQQFYMQDADFKKVFSLKRNESTNYYPVYIERPSRWVYPWWQQPCVWSSSGTYSAAHSSEASLQGTTSSDNVSYSG